MSYFDADEIFIIGTVPFKNSEKWSKSNNLLQVEINQSIIY